MQSDNALVNPVLDSEYFRLLVQNSSDIVSILEPDGTLRFVSPAVESILGYSPNELIGHKSFSYIHKDDLPDLNKTFAELLKHPNVQKRVNVRYHHANGNWIWLDAIGTNLLDDPRIRGILVNSRDVTSSKDFEEALQQSKKKYQTLYDTAKRQAQEMGLLDRVRTAISSELELGSLFRTVVEAVVETFGYTQVSLYILENENLIMQHQVGYEHVILSIPINSGVIGRVVRSGKPVLLSNVKTDPDFLGAIEGVVSEVSVPLFDAGRTVGVLNVESINGFTLDQADLQLMLAITEQVGIAITRARMHSQISKNEKKYRAVVDNIKEVIFQTDEEGNLTFLNPAWTTVSGYSIEESLGQNLFSYLTPVNPPSSELLLNVLIENKGEYFSHLEKCRTKQGDFRWLDCYARLVIDDNGQSTSIFGMLRDITEKRRTEQALRESEEQFRQVLQRREQEFRALVENAKDIITRYDTQMRVLYVNPIAKKVWNLDPEYCIGKNIKELGASDEFAAQFQAKFDKVVQTKQDLEFTLNISRWRSPKYNHTHLVPEFDENGEVVSVLSISRDVTDLKVVENALRDSEASFRLLFSDSPLPMYVYDLDSLRFLEVNDVAVRQYGYSHEEFLNLNLAQLRPSSDLPQLMSEVEKARTNSNEIKQWRHMRKNGEIFDVEVTTHTLDFSGKKALMVVAQDVTARKQAEDALAAERERLSVTLRSINEGVITIDTNNNITLLNKVAEDLLGWTQAEVLGKPLNSFFRIIHRTETGSADTLLTLALQKGLTLDSDHQTLLVDRHGVEKLISYTGASIYDRDNNVIGGVIAFNDITEKQKLADERLKASKLESLGLLAGGVAHDFNNLLTSILTNMVLAKSNLENPPFTQQQETQLYLGDAEKAVLRARDLTRQLLTFAKGGSPIKKTAILSEIIAESARFVLHGSSVECSIELPEDLWPVEVDQGQLGQVIQNLVINAIQAMPTGGHLWIKGENIILPADTLIPLNDGRYVKILVQDTGTGIGAEELPKIFDPYFTTKAHGTGLGLATCYSIIKRHDGYINVESSAEIGTTFTIYLPSSVNSVIPKVENADNHPEKGGSGRILVMDDEEIIRDVMSKLLGQMGYEVEVAGDGAEAIARYKAALTENRPFSVVIMDLTIRGGMGGKEAIKKLLSLDPQVKAIVSSGYSNDQVMSNYREHGFQGMVVKPFQLEELTKVLNNVIKNEG